MKYLNLFKKLSPINQNQNLLEHGSILFKDLQPFSAILENEELIIFCVLLNWAVDDLEDEEIYCQLGVNSFSTLIAALVNHPDCMAYAVDSFYQQNNSSNYENIVDNLDNLNLTEQVFLFDQDPEEFLLELKTVDCENKIGLFVYDWKKDYRSVLYSLLLIKSFLSDQSLIIIEGVNHPSVQQAIADFLSVNPEFIIEEEFLSQSYQSIFVGNGRVVLSRDINRNISLESSVVFNYRQPQIIERISQIEQLENLLETIYQEAVKLHHEYKFTQAENKYKIVLNWNKNHMESWINLSQLYYQSEDYQQSLQASFQVIKVDSERFEGYYNLGQCLEKLNQIAQAIAAYQKTIVLKPDHIDAYNNLGNLLTQQGQFIEAETLYRQGINVNPNHFGSYLNLGNLFLLQNQIESALENYQIALEIVPNNPDILYNLELAKEQQKNPASYCSSFGDRLYELGNYQGAIAQYQKILNLQQQEVNTYEKIHQCYWNLGEYDSAINILKTALELYSQFAPLHFTLITNLLYEGRTEEATTQAKIASECLPKDYTFTLLKNLIVPMFYHSVEEISYYQEQFRKGLKTLIETTNFNDPETLEQAFLGMGRFTNFYLGYQARNIIKEQQIYGNFLHQMMSAKYPQWVQALTLPTVEDKIRVGYVSNYLHCYSGSLWLTGWLRYANHNQFEIYSYYTGNSPDPVTEQFRQYSYKFYHIPDNLEAVAEQIFKDKLHILVYPEIGMNPPTMELAALRLVPIQCTAWGHPVTSGLPTIDYFLSSQLMEPENSQEHYSETLILLPNIGVAYPKPQDIPALVKTRSDYDLPEDAVIYLCCQAPFKYLPQYDYILPEIAVKVPNARFLFFRGTLLNARLKQAFAHYGLNDQDYCLHRNVPERFDYLMLNLLSDVFLDTFTWSGGNTSLEAIACNLPIVTCPGEFMRGRHADSFLKMIGLTETIAENEAEYIKIAVKLGLDPVGRKTLSEQMSDRHHLIFDDQVCVTGLEEFYQTVIGL
ncbi:O-linked N-acetylglucosamine transferase family protein [Planktothrix paucivesiculata]|uniref:protein O-GlcNAc transferase n=1 Tax=Planktothrix paucivesiculata PCC 9631 TaxID=671071 RepID=A0A7Z9C293_9CYAN|nr:tetratricopeptide repeat protein [Planktothrix paucivesiculata]VXD25768.1 Tetratricopeptide TPR_2 [Planktothrix paucivesiculata PCC 9631]